MIDNQTLPYNTHQNKYAVNLGNRFGLTLRYLAADTKGSMYYQAF